MTGETCRRGFDALCEKAECHTDKYAKWEYTGFTRRIRKAYWDAIQKRLLSEYESNAALHGIDLRGEKSFGGKFSKEEAEAYIKNPLKDFPNDVDYSQFKEDSLNFKRAECAAFMKKVNRPLTFDESKLFWTSERISAIQGDDIVSKRAAVRGELWALYLEMKKHRDVTIESLRSVIAADFRFLKILPSESEMVEYNKNRTSDKLYSLSGIVTEIPDKHLQKLFDADAFPQELMSYVSI